MLYQELSFLVSFRSVSGEKYSCRVCVFFVDVALMLTIEPDTPTKSEQIGQP
jgi:hypothetical protein